MSIERVKELIEGEISALQAALKALSVPEPDRVKRASKKAAPVVKKRTMSEAGRKAIADAVKKRWALKKKKDSKAVPAS